LRLGRSDVGPEYNSGLGHEGIGVAGSGSGAMGIKFRCPNGHKLNVKSFLAGKRGVCPDCGTTFRIPEEPGGSDILALPLPSTRSGNGQPDSQPQPAGEAFNFDFAASAPSAAAVKGPAAPVAPSPTVAPVVKPAATVPVGSPVASGIPLPTSPATVPASVTAPGVVPAAVPQSFPAGIARPAAVPTGAPTVGDPIAEAPAAIWYVRPPSGGQYGPARGDIMRKWIAEGRVSGDSLVWREGWTDWRSAGQLFPSLASPPSAASVVSVASVTTAPQSARSASRYPARKKGGSGLAIAALVGLILVCVALVVVLVVVLARQA
jgi:hypothetical protein